MGWAWGGGRVGTGDGVGVGEEGEMWFGEETGVKTDGRVRAGMGGGDEPGVGQVRVGVKLGSGGFEDGHGLGGL